MPSKILSKFKDILFSLSLPLVSSFLFFLSHPNFIFVEGVPFFAWFCYFPLFLSLLQKENRKTVFAECLYSFSKGGVFGFTAYFLFGSWLFSYRPLAGVLICIVYGIYYGLISAGFTVLDRFLKNSSWILKPVIFTVAEYLRTLGFFGLNYGVIGYSQYSSEILLASAPITGVWGITFLIIFSNIVISDILFRILRKNPFDFKIIFEFSVFCITGLIFVFLGLNKIFENKKIISQGAKSRVNVVLIQNNSDPWAGGITEYRKEVYSLISLTKKALEEHPDTNIVVWPETAVVPDIMMNFYSPLQSERKSLVTELLEFIENASCVFVIGNNYSEIHDGMQKSYNSVLVFESGKNAIPPNPEIYSKIHLVPFEESFPFEKKLPFIHKKLVENGAHFWTAGDKFTVFKTEFADFCTPVCFEDTFSPLVKKLCNGGAELIVNLSNDSWSKRVDCQYQHLSMAVFRSAENEIPTVRSTNSGQTCYIDFTGKISAMLAPYTAAYLYCTVDLF